MFCSFFALTPNCVFCYSKLLQQPKIVTHNFPSDDFCAVYYHSWASFFDQRRANGMLIKIAKEDLNYKSHSYDVNEVGSVLNRFQNIRGLDIYPNLKTFQRITFSHGLPSMGLSSKNDYLRSNDPIVYFVIIQITTKKSFTHPHSMVKQADFTARNLIKVMSS